MRKRRAQIEMLSRAQTRRTDAGNCGSVRPHRAGWGDSGGVGLILSMRCRLYVNLLNLYLLYSPVTDRRLFFDPRLTAADRYVETVKADEVAYGGDIAGRQEHV
jgi:hypothetical protein